MKEYCQYCGTENELNHAYDNEWVYDKDGEVIHVIMGMPSPHKKCMCGKMVYGFYQKNEIKKDIQAFRSNIDTGQVVKVLHDAFYLFKLGEYWYNAPYIPNDNVEDDRDSQLKLF